MQRADWAANYLHTIHTIPLRKSRLKYLYIFLHMCTRTQISYICICTLTTWDCDLLSLPSLLRSTCRHVLRGKVSVLLNVNDIANFLRNWDFPIREMANFPFHSTAAISLSLSYLHPLKFPKLPRLWHCEMAENHELGNMNSTHRSLGEGTFSGITAGTRYRQKDESDLARLGKKQVLKVCHW